MGAERRNYVMPVGLALQRELAYRQKLLRLTTERCLKKYPLSSQVPNPTSSQAPRTTLAPTPNSGPPQPYVGPRPWQAPLWRPNTCYRGLVPGSMLLVSPQFPRPYTRPSPHFGQTHSAGQKRKKPVEGESYFCDLCQVDCNNPFNLRVHLNGQKHKANLTGESPTIEAACETKPAEKYHCELCGVCCSREFSFDQHLNGKKHHAKLRACGYDMSGVASGTYMN